jgi:hypothetical protein
MLKMKTFEHPYSNCQVEAHIYKKITQVSSLVLRSFTDPTGYYSIPNTSACTDKSIFPDYLKNAELCFDKDGGTSLVCENG